MNIQELPIGELNKKGPAEVQKLSLAKETARAAPFAGNRSVSGGYPVTDNSKAVVEGKSTNPPCTKFISQSQLVYIVKYKNKKYYDQTNGRYVGLIQMANLVLEHVPFRVIDYQTKLDISAFTLVKAVLEKCHPSISLTEVKVYFEKFELAAA